MAKKKEGIKLIHVLLIIGIIILVSRTPGIGRAASYSYFVDYGQSIGTQQMHYGAQEDDGWDAFADNPSFQQYHRDVGTEYLRVWISAQSYRPSTFPLRSDGSYDWGNVDKLIDATLKSDAIPVVVFAHGDRCGDREQYTNPFDFSNCEGHGAVPPTDDDEFVDYVETVVQHFKDKCGSQTYARSCNVNEWYFEIWNEPSGTAWTSGYYYTLYNKAEPAIHSIAPNSKVGGPGKNLRLEADNKPDFVVRHLYANMYCGDTCTDSTRMSSTSGYLDWIEDYGYAGTGIEMINGEYNIDWGSGSVCASDFAGKWLVSALINQIEGDTDMELFYSGTAYGNTQGWGMWGKNGNKWSTYYAKKNFVALNPTGATLYKENANINDFDIMASSHSGKRFLTIVNKKGSSSTLNLEIRGATGVNKLVNLENQEQHAVSGIASLTFDAYEVKFLEATGGVITCTTHNLEKCYEGDVYWYDSCGVREDKKEDCGTNTCLGDECVSDEPDDPSACDPKYACTNTGEFKINERGSLGICAVMGYAEDCPSGTSCDKGDTSNSISGLCKQIGSTSICGDGDKEGSEECDDNNLVNGDGCSSTCRIESTEGMTFNEFFDNNWQILLGVFGFIILIALFAGRGGRGYRRY